jgi:glycosyltransferase involved in cell wall biosynthesis
VSRPRVAVVITRLEGGAGLLALRGAELIGASAELSIITGSGEQLMRYAACAGLEVITEPTLRTPIDPASDIEAVRRLAALFQRREFSVVHTHTAKAGAAGRVAAARAGVPWIVHTYHGFPFHQFQSPVRRAAYVAIERKLGAVTDVALCVGSAVAAEAARRRLVRPERIRTIGVVIPDAAAAAAAMSARRPETRARARGLLGLPADATVVGTVGRLTFQKAPEDFAAAVRRLDRPGAIGVWVGSGELAGRMARLARRSGASLVLAGERTDVLDVLPAFDVFALTSRYEGLPTVVVEAMICGVPVVATAVNAVGDLVIPGETGLLVPPGRPELMAQAISFLLASPSTGARLAAAAHERLGDRYRSSALQATLTAAYAPQTRWSPAAPGQAESADPTAEDLRPPADWLPPDPARQPDPSPA